MSLQTALIVDDSKLARITLQRLLEKRNFQVRMAESAIQAFELLKQDLPDIIFMDHLMPEVDGFEAMKQIKADPATRHIPVVMCTGKEGAEDYDAQAKAIGASATLSKPPELEQLNQVLAETQPARSGADTHPAQNDAALQAIQDATAHPDQSMPTAGSTEPTIDATALEQRLQDAMLQAIASLRVELKQELVSVDLSRQELVQENDNSLRQELNQIRSDMIHADQIHAWIQNELEPLRLTTQSAPPIEQPAVDLDSLRADFAGQLIAAKDQLSRQIDAMQQTFSSAAPSRDDTAHEAIQALHSQLEGALAQEREMTEIALTSLLSRMEQLEASDNSRAAAPDGLVLDQIRSELEQKLEAFSRNIERMEASLLAAQDQQQRDDHSTSHADVAALTQAFEARIEALQERISDEIAAVRADIPVSDTGLNTPVDSDELEAKVVDSAVAAVEQTIDALLAHKVEQIRNTLTLEMKAQARGTARSDVSSEVPAPDAAESVRQLAHEAVSEELDQASAHLVATITEALRHQVEETQQEILAKQDMFEQERGALRRQIRSLKNTLIMVSTGAGLLAAIAIATLIIK